MKHSLTSPSTVADVMTKKYVNGLPLARQEKIWARQGVELSRATLANWVIQCTQTWLKPMYRHMKRTLLEDAVIHANETTVQVLKEDGKAATSESRMWIYASWKGSKKPIRIFEYQPDGSGKRPANFLKGFGGHLVTDGYAGYNQVKNVTHCGCWAHTRRKWREAMPDGATVKTSKAAVGYRYCTKLFALDGKTIHLLPKTRKAFPRPCENTQGIPPTMIETEYIFHSSTGGMLSPTNWYKRNYKTFMASVIAQHPEIPFLTPHELRHTRATLWKDAGVDLFSIAKLMGHADLDMLAKRYAHNNVETLRKALQIDRPSHADRVIRYQCRNGVVVKLKRAKK